MNSPRAILSRIAAVVAIVAGLSAAAVPALAGESDGSLQEAKAATARFHSIVQAEKAGYVLGSPCISSPAGAMGFHYENHQLMADPAVDATQPEILLYAPGPSGRLQLVGIEYWKADADQNPATTSDRPSLFGQPFNGPMPGHHPGMPIHYDLHVWLWQDNPAGTFAPFNPTVTC
jgi:hypothetical protein